MSPVQRCGGEELQDLLQRVGTCRRTCGWKLEQLGIRQRAHVVILYTEVHAQFPEAEGPESKMDMWTTE